MFCRTSCNITQKSKIAAVAVLTFLFIFSFTLSLAQDRELEIDYPEVFGEQPETVVTPLPEYVNYLFGLAIWLVGLVAFGAMVWGGIIWLTASGNPSRLKEGMDRITSAFLGIVILLASYIILNIINPQLISFDIRPLLGIPTEPRTPPPPLEPEEVTLIAKEIPLGQALERGVWEQERTNRIRTIFLELEAFFGETINSEDPTAPPTPGPSIPGGPVPSLLADVQAERAKYGSLLCPEEAGVLLNAVAWANRANGWGLSGKNFGNRCPSPAGEIACDILHHQPTNILVDVLIDGPPPCEPAIPAWQVLGPPPPNRPWVAPVQP